MSNKAMVLATKTVHSVLSHLEDVGEVKTISFPQWGGGGWGGTGTNTYYDLFPHQPGSSRDYASSIGDVLDNSVVSACINAKAKAVMEATPFLERKEKGQWVRVEDNDDLRASLNGQPSDKVREYLCIENLRNPNGHMADDHFWGVLVAAEDVRGNGYWRLPFNSRTRCPAEIWPVSSWETPIAPMYGPQGQGCRIKNYDPARFIGGYRIMVDGKPEDCTAAANFEEDARKYDYQEDTVIHFRANLDPYNLRVGRPALRSGYRQIEGDNSAATYQAAIVRNVAMASFIVTLKERDPNITPGQLLDVINRLENKLQGDGAARIAGSNLPVDITRAGYSPDEMSLDTTLVYYESRICALLETPPMVINLLSAKDQRTYSNYQEALQDFWRRTMRPRLNKWASELTVQYLPLFGLDNTRYRISFDFSKVWALQKDIADEQDRSRQNFRMRGIDLYEFRAAIGAEAKEEYKGVAYNPASGDYLDPAKNQQQMNGEGQQEQENPQDGDEDAAPWSDEDSDKLSSLWTSAENDELLQAFPGHSESDIMAQARSLGLPGAKSWMQPQDTFTLNGYPVNGYSNGHSTATAALSEIQESLNGHNET